MPVVSIGIRRESHKPHAQTPHATQQVFRHLLQLTNLLLNSLCGDSEQACPDAGEVLNPSSSPWDSNSGPLSFHQHSSQRLSPLEHRERYIMFVHCDSSSARCNNERGGRVEGREGWKM